MLAVIAGIELSPDAGESAAAWEAAAGEDVRALAAPRSDAVRAGADQFS
jgi:hypothetical protein